MSDLTGGMFNDLRVLDLGCLEGGFSVELALHGARVVAIEGRDSSVDKVEFVKEILSLDALEVVQDDVRSLGKEKYGSFDIVLCLGILYHLDVPDSFHFIKHVHDVCERFAVIDTHFSPAPEKSCVYEGCTYWGKEYIEHADEDTVERRAQRLWASLDNPRSFWFTRSSLLNLLSRTGFNTVYECLNPSVIDPDYLSTRATLVAVKGGRPLLLSSPLSNGQRDEDWPERR